jgi:hypothetical protein
VTGHDDQHLMWGALIRRSVVCCTPAPAPPPLSLRDDRVEGATTELTAVGGPRCEPQIPGYLLIFEATVRPLVAAMALGLIWIGAVRMEAPAATQRKIARWDAPIWHGFIGATRTGPTR